MMDMEDFNFKLEQLITKIEDFSKIKKNQKK